MKDLKELNAIINGDVDPCENCPDASPDCCDGCIGSTTTDNGLADYVDNMQDVSDTLYKIGCWTVLENKIHDVRSEWSLLADDCKHQLEASDRDEILCAHAISTGFECEFDNCPRLKS